MGKYNKKASIEGNLIRRPDITVNEEGGLAFSSSPKTDLTLRIMTYLVGEPKFYGDTENELDDISVLIAKVAEEDPEYLLKLASYARNEMYLRSAPLFLLVDGAKYAGVKSVMRKYVPSIVKRADELAETIALFIHKNGQIGKSGRGSLPNALKKGLADTFHNFNEYQLAKYDRNGEVKLSDVIRLVHPRPKTSEEAELFGRVRTRTLVVPKTWETVISEKGSTKDAWESVIPDMGYMAKLRNLRNFLKVGVDITPVVKHLINPKAVAGSKQFPFRFLSAYKVLEKENIGNPFVRKTLMETVIQALELSVDNIPSWGGRTFVSCDNSGSMDDMISEKSTVTRNEVGNIMGALAHRISDNALTSVFGECFAIVKSNPRDSVMTNAFKAKNTDVGHSTYAYKAIEYLVENGIDIDRILVFSDMQCYGPENRHFLFTRWNDAHQTLTAQLSLYKAKVNPNVKLYSFDLAGYGTLQFPETEKNVVLLAGFSDRIFEFVKLYEEFGTTLISKIESYRSS